MSDDPLAMFLACAVEKDTQAHHFGLTIQALTLANFHAQQAVVKCECGLGMECYAVKKALEIGAVLNDFVTMVVEKPTGAFHS